MNQKYFDCVQNISSNKQLYNLISKLSKREGATTSLVCAEVEFLLSNDELFSEEKISKLQKADKLIDLLINDKNRSEMEKLKKYIDQEIKNVR